MSLVFYISKCYIVKMSVWIKVFHFIAVVHYYFGLYYYVTEVADKEQIYRKYKFGGIFVHLTLLTYIVHMTFFTLALLNDFVGSNSVSNKSRPLIRKVKDYIFGSLAVPLSVYVFGIFWTLFIIKRDLIYPRLVDAFLPWWLNHFLHTNIAPFMLIEMIIICHKYPKRKLGLAGISTFMFGYLIWMLIIKLETSYWVYPILNRFELHYQVVALIALSLSGMAIYLIAELVNSLIWHQGRVERALKLEESRNSLLTVM